MKKKGTSVASVESAGAGDIVSMAGLASPAIGHTISTVEVHRGILYIYLTIALLFSFLFLFLLGL